MQHGSFNVLQVMVVEQRILVDVAVFRVCYSFLRFRASGTSF